MSEAISSSAQGDQLRDIGDRVLRGRRLKETGRVQESLAENKELKRILGW